jgi:hypothetical protein
VPTPPPFYANWVFWLYLGTLLIYLSCLVLYGLRSPWRFEPVGRALFAVLASLTSVLLFAVVALSGVIPRSMTDVLRAALLGSVAVAGCFFLRQIIRLQREARSPDEEH